MKFALEKYRAIPDFTHDGDSALLGWELKSTGKIIGQSNFTFESLVNEKGSIGYVVHPKFAGQGYSFEATQALIEFIFRNLVVRRITATIDPRNTKSIALAERLGFQWEVTFEGDEFIKDEWVDTSIYTLLRKIGVILSNEFVTPFL
ncbi:MAG: GNAT family protein [Actinomycetota bacterium]